MTIRRHWFTGIISLAVIVFLWAPLAIVAINSVNKNPLLARWSGFTTSWYHQAITNPDVRAGHCGGCRPGSRPYRDRVSTRTWG